MPRRVFVSFTPADYELANEYITALRAAGIDVRIPADPQAIDAACDVPSAFLLLVSEASMHDTQVIALLNHYLLLWENAESAGFEKNPYLLLPVYLAFYPLPEAIRSFATIGGVIFDLMHVYNIKNIIEVVALPQWEPMAIPERLESLGYKGWRTRFTGWYPTNTAFILPPLCSVPAGECLIGSDTGVDPLAYSNEMPRRRMHVDAFKISAYPVTVAEYTCYLTSESQRWDKESIRYYGIGPRGGSGEIIWEQQLEHPEHPVACLNWHQARAYGEWLRRLTFQPWRLPTEIEWEKAARWDAQFHQARIYPWGDLWDQRQANTNEGGPGQSTPVGAYSISGDASPYGLHDLAGNVYEWTNSLWETSSSNAGIQEQRGDNEWYKMHVLRGGSWRDMPRFARAAFRTGFDPDAAMDDSGFRIVR